MLPEAPTTSQIAVVISQSTGPAFLLGVVAGLVSVRVGRLERILDRSRAMHSTSDTNPKAKELLADLPRLERRARLVNRALFFAATSGLVTTMLIAVAFTCAFFAIEHERGVALLFIVAVTLFALGILNFMQEIRISLRRLDHFG